MRIMYRGICGMRGVGREVLLRRRNVGEGIHATTRWRNFGKWGRLVQRHDRNVWLGRFMQREETYRFLILVLVLVQDAIDTIVALWGHSLVLVGFFDGQLLRHFLMGL